MVNTNERGMENNTNCWTRKSSPLSQRFVSERRHALHLISARKEHRDAFAVLL